MHAPHEGSAHYHPINEDYHRNEGFLHVTKKRPKIKNLKMLNLLIHASFQTRDDSKEALKYH